MNRDIRQWVALQFRGVDGEINLNLKKQQVTLGVTLLTTIHKTKLLFQLFFCTPVKLRRSHEESFMVCDKEVLRACGCA
jgi:hypothetical protein